MRFGVLAVVLAVGSVFVVGCVSSEREEAQVWVKHTCSEALEVLGSPYMSSIEERNNRAGNGFEVHGRVIPPGEPEYVTSASAAGGSFSLWVDEAG